jgi:hypothetical protein
MSGVRRRYLVNMDVITTKEITEELQVTDPRAVAAWVEFARSQQGRMTSLRTLGLFVRFLNTVAVPQPVETVGSTVRAVARSLNYTSIVAFPTTTSKS